MVKERNEISDQFIQIQIYYITNQQGRKFGMYLAQYDIYIVEVETKK